MCRELRTCTSFIVLEDFDIIEACRVIRSEKGTVWAGREKGDEMLNVQEPEKFLFTHGSGGLRYY